MNRVNKALVIVMIIEVVAAIIVWRPQSETKATGEALITDFSADSITHLQIEDDSGNEITLAKNDASYWVLPNYDDYPANGTKVSTLLGKFENLKTGRLITRSDTSHRRLNVADDTFLRRIHLQGADDADYTLYIGNSGGGNATHIRVSDEDPVYLVDNLRTTDAPTTLSNWIDTTYFTVSSQNVVSVTLENANGIFEFTKDGDTWTMTSPQADRDSDPTKISSVISQLSTLRMQEPISRDADDSFGLDTPTVTVTIQVQEPVEIDTATPEEGDQTETPETEIPEIETPESVINTYTYQFGTEQEDGYIAKSSESDYYVRVASTTADSIINKTIDDFLVELPPSPTPDATEEPSQ